MSSDTPRRTTPRTTHQRTQKKTESPVPSQEKRPACKRRFLVPLLVEIEVEERLLDDALTAEWQQNFYCLTSPVDVAGHLTYNLIQGRRLSSLDGFADQPESAARILDIHVEDDDTQELPRHAWAGGALQIREGSQGREYNWECTCGMTGEEWYAIPRHATRSYQRHLVNGARAPEASPK